MRDDEEPAAWRRSLARAATVPAVVDIVQLIVRARRRHSPAQASSPEPHDITSREDIEHWDRRVRMNRSRDSTLLETGDLLRLALDRMNELGPRRSGDSRGSP